MEMSADVYICSVMWVSRFHFHLVMRVTQDSSDGAPAPPATVPVPVPDSAVPVGAPAAVEGLPPEEAQ